ncbi:MAG: CvpA family protein [bacterium]|nr:CvpA family protein [bacterium]
MTLIDWILVVLWAGIALSGFWKGAVRIVFGVGGLIAGIWLASVAGSDVAARLEPSVGVEWIAVGLGWFLPVLLCVGVCLLAGWGVERTLEALHLKWLNRLLGAVIAGAAGLILLLCLIIAGMQLSPDLAELCAESYLIPRLLDMLSAF